MTVYRGWRAALTGGQDSKPASSTLPLASRASAIGVCGATSRVAIGTGRAINIWSCASSTFEHIAEIELCAGPPCVLRWEEASSSGARLPHTALALLRIAEGHLASAKPDSNVASDALYGKFHGPEANVHGIGRGIQSIALCGEYLSYVVHSLPSSRYFPLCSQSSPYIVSPHIVSRLIATHFPPMSSCCDYLYSVSPPRDVPRGRPHPSETLNPYLKYIATGWRVCRYSTLCSIRSTALTSTRCCSLQEISRVHRRVAFGRPLAQASRCALCRA